MAKVKITSSKNMVRDYPIHDRDSANKLDRAFLFAKSAGVDFEKILLPLIKDYFCSYHRPHRKHIKLMCDEIWEQVKEHMEGGEKD